METIQVHSKRGLRSYIKALISVTVCAVFVFALFACTPAKDGASSEKPSVKIGTMPTEDMLPAWVALENGFFEDAGLNAEIISFDSAQGLSAAITSGDVDMAMTDIMRAVKLTEAGCPVDMEWITLGTDASQGRFGIVAAADAPYSTLSEMAAFAQSGDAPDGFGVGVAANTVPEYVFDQLCLESDLEIGDIPAVEVASLPERFSLTASGNLGGAALPNSLLVLAQSQGMKILAQDTDGANLSQSVMVARSAWAADHQEIIELVAQCWDEAVDLIAQDPSSYVALLIENANINESIAEIYPVSSYPHALTPSLAHPSKSLVDPLIEWMHQKGYSTKQVAYDASTGMLTLA